MSLQFNIQPARTVSGEIRVPGDKSISHRSIMFGSIAEGVTHVSGFLQGEDSLNTLRAFRAMGVRIDGPDNGDVIIHGVGMRGLQAPNQPLDVGNSGTSMRLLVGLLAGQVFDVELVGDRSLNKRPMRRVTEPLAAMGACVDTAADGKPPLKVHGGSQLQGIDYTMPMASAQVKSCLLLAGMYAEDQTCVTEPATTRDHTERMLKAFGYEVRCEANRICLSGGGKLTACDIDVPADISSAAFFMVMAAIAEDAELTIQHVGINPTRTGVIDILRLMGADITLQNEREVGGEPVADILVRSSRLKGIQVPEELVPLAIDEFPVIFVAAACAEGTTVVTGAHELRVKESDRIQVMADGLNTLGIDARATDDGMVIQGGHIQSGTVDSHDDHRIAMAFTVASLRATGEIIINECDNVNTSFPNFVELAREVGIQIEVTQ